MWRSSLGRKPMEVKLTLANVPEMLFVIRREMSRVLRRAADQEDERTSKRLISIAGAFEVGQSIEERDAS